MQKWEYFIYFTCFDAQERTQVLNSAGMEGWELVSFAFKSENCREYVFKRAV